MQKILALSPIQCIKRNAGLSRLSTCSYPEESPKGRARQDTQADMVFHHEREYLSSFKALIPNPLSR